MFLSKKKPLVAVDMGSHSIKLVQLGQLKNGSFELVSLGMMPLEQGSIVKEQSKTRIKYQRLWQVWLRRKKFNRTLSFLPCREKLFL